MTSHLASDTAGANIRMIRKSRGWSVAELAGRIKQLGEHITASVVENIEHGRRRDGERTRDITVDELTVIADALMVSPGMLLPELDNPGYQYGDATDHDVYMATVISNLQVALHYLESRRTQKAAATPDPE